jgi:tripeptide aminopeptidase
MNNHVKQIDDTFITGLVIPRFLKYVRYCTTSDRYVETTPSSAGQWELAKAVTQELKELGIQSVELTDHCYIIARIPATPGKEDCPTVGFMAHLDTADDVSGKDVTPCLVENYDGNRIELADGYVLDPETQADLGAQKGKAIIHTDGTTLLGADDKAGIAEIMGAFDYLLNHPEIAHGPVEAVFTPDEETGKGLPEFPLEKIKSTACYTLDGGAVGELEIECFNAYKADVLCTGKVMHLGYARGLMANATLMASAFALMLPRSESPEATDGYYGYYCPTNIKGTTEQASLEVYLRDFERTGMERRLNALEHFARAVEAQFPGGTVSVQTKAQYYNMKEKIDARPEVLEMLKKAASNVGIAFRLKPIRGGTDGSRLTEMGIPTPNIFTGGRNWHSRIEWASVSEMTAACKVIIELIRLWGAGSS